MALLGGGGVKAGETPVQAKTALVEQLTHAIAQTTVFCTECGINLSQIQIAQGFERIRFVCDAVEAILINDQSKQRYLALTRNVTKLYKAILPDPAASEFGAMQYLFSAIAQRIYSLNPEVDILRSHASSRTTAG